MLATNLKALSLSIRISMHYLFGGSPLTNVFLNIFYIFSVTTIYCGNFGHLYKMFQNGISFGNVSHNIAILISASYAYFVLYAFKSNKKNMAKVLDRMENNPYLSFQHFKLLRMAHRLNNAQKFVYGYLFIIEVLALLIVEFQDCDQDLQPYTCGYIVPTVCKRF